jgi:hypothetical protein
MRKHKYIKSIENRNNIIFSVIEIKYVCDLYNFLIGKNLTKEYEELGYDFQSKKEVVNHSIFSTKQPFYIEVYVLDQNQNKWGCNIYYETKNENEFKLFIKKFKKELYDRDNLKRIED